MRLNDRANKMLINMMPTNNACYLYNGHEHS
jgi:hypothetical protein